MGKIKRGLGIVLLIVMLAALPGMCFAESAVSFDKAQQSVSAVTDNAGDNAKRRSCFERGSATLTQISGCNLAIEAEAFAYHNVDQIGMTVYLQEMRNGHMEEVESWSVDNYNTDNVKFGTGYTVDGNADYRLYVIYNTRHTADGVGLESDTAATTWMWIGSCH